MGGGVPPCSISLSLPPSLCPSGLCTTCLVLTKQVSQDSAHSCVALRLWRWGTLWPEEHQRICKPISKPLHTRYGRGGIFLCPGRSLLQNTDWLAQQDPQPWAQLDLRKQSKLLPTPSTTPPGPLEERSCGGSSLRSGWLGLNKRNLLQSASPGCLGADKISGSFISGKK